MQSFVGDHVLLSQHLPARGADVAVELGGGVRLPNILFVLFGFVGAWLLLDPEVVVSREQFLLLGRVWQQHQQLLENLLEVFPQQFPAAFVILSCRDQPLQGIGKGNNQRKRNIYLLKNPPGIQASQKWRLWEPTHLPELPRMSFEFIELGLIALKKFFNGLYELDVPLLEVLRYQI